MFAPTQSSLHAKIPGSCTQTRIYLRACIQAHQCRHTCTHSHSRTPTLWCTGTGIKTRSIFHGAATPFVIFIGGWIGIVVLAFARLIAICSVGCIPRRFVVRVCLGLTWHRSHVGWASRGYTPVGAVHGESKRHLLHVVHHCRERCSVVGDLERGVSTTLRII